MATGKPTQEQWRPIPGYEGYYEVSDHGRVRSLDRTIERSNGQEVRRKGRVLRPGTYVSGHKHVNLHAPERKRKWRVHHLVLLAFVGPMPEGMEVCHNNGNPADNRLENLRYDTHSSNLLDRNDHGTCIYRQRTHCPRGHKLEMPNLVRVAWEKRGHRTCLACQRMSARVSKHPELKGARHRISDEHYAAIMGDNVAF